MNQHQQQLKIVKECSGNLNVEEVKRSNRHALPLLCGWPVSLSVKAVCHFVEEKVKLFERSTADVNNERKSSRKLEVATTTVPRETLETRTMQKHCTLGMKITRVR